MVFYASQTGPIEFVFPIDEKLPFQGTYRAVVQLFKGAKVQLPEPNENIQVITDQVNPLGKLQLESAKEHWKVMRTIFKEDFWLHYF